MSDTEERKICALCVNAKHIDFQYCFCKAGHGFLANNNPRKNCEEFQFNTEIGE